MNDRCRVFALNGEELFPCRWAKAKKLVAANVAKKATIDGKMCIKMLEPTRMNKLQEAIMNNEKKETRCIGIGSGEYNACSDNPIKKIELNAEEVFVNGKLISEAKQDLLPSTEFKVKDDYIQKSDGTLNTTLDIINKLKQENKFEFPDALYQFDSESNAIIVFKFDCVSPANENMSTYTYDTDINRTQKIPIMKDRVNDLIGYAYPGYFRTTLSLAIKDFEMFRAATLKQLRSKLLHFELTKIPKIIE